MIDKVANKRGIEENILLCLFLAVYLLLPAYVNSGFLVVLFLLRILKKRTGIIRPNSIMIILFFLVLLNLISILYAKNQVLALKESTTWIMFLLMTYISSEDGLFDSSKTKYFALGILILNVFYIINQMFGISILSLSPPTVNCTATIDCLAVILFENQIINGQVKRPVYCRMLQVICIFSIVISSVRGIIPLLALYYVYYILVKQGRYKMVSMTRKVVSIFGIIIIATVTVYYLPVLWPNFNNQMSTLFNSDVYSNRVRLLLYGKAIRYTYENHFIFGIGAGNFTEYYSVISVPGFQSMHSHSIFIQPFVELGIIGFILTVGLFFAVFKKSIQTQGNQKLLYLELITPFLLYGIVDYVWTDMRVGLFFFIIIGQLLRDWIISRRRISFNE